MKKQTLALLPVLVLVLSGPSLFARTPTEALTAFLKAAKAQQFEDVWKHTAQFEGASEEVTEYLKSRVQRALKGAAEGWSSEILEEKVLGDGAVIVVNESTQAGEKAFDIDPIYLIRQKGEWKVFPHATMWDLTKRIPAEKQPASMKLDEKQTADYKALETWFAERKKVLIKQHREQRKL